MPKVLNKKHDLIPLGSSIYIGRPSPWGNPFIIGPDGTREDVLEKFALYLFENPEFVDQIQQELRGKNLVCFCAPEPCHGDILLQIANQEED